MHRPTLTIGGRIHNICRRLDTGPVIVSPLFTDGEAGTAGIQRHGKAKLMVLLRLQRFNIGLLMPDGGSIVALVQVNSPGVAQGASSRFGVNATRWRAVGICP